MRYRAERRARLYRASLGGDDDDARAGVGAALTEGSLLVSTAQVDGGDGVRASAPGRPRRTGETLACGTGAVAAALIASVLGRVKPPVEIVPRSGEKLVISFEQGEGTFGRIFLDGEAKVICEGMLHV